MSRNVSQIYIISILSALLYLYLFEDRAICEKNAKGAPRDRESA